MKAAMKGAVSADAWRPPKPTMPTGPEGAHGGRGLNISNLSGQLAVAEAASEEARTKVTEAAQRLLRLESIIDSLSNPSPELLDAKEGAKAALDLARGEVRQTASAVDSLLHSVGSQWEDRLDEEAERAAARGQRDVDREYYKGQTRPHYDSWKVGAGVIGDSRSVRDDANRLLSGIGLPTDGVPPEKMAAAKALSKEAKRLAKEAKEAGKLLKNASKYGSRAEIEAAEKKAKEANERAREAMDAAHRTLDPDVETGHLLAPETSPEDAHLLAAGLQPDRLHACGDPVAGCSHVEVFCEPWQKRVCAFGLDAPPPGASPPGTKGSGGGGGVQSGDSQGSTADSRAGAGEAATGAAGDGAGEDGQEGEAKGEPVKPEGSEVTPKEKENAEEELSEEDLLLLKTADDSMEKIQKATDSLGGKLESLLDRNRTLLEKEAFGATLSPTERRRLTNLMDKVQVLAGALERLSRLADATGALGLAGLETGGEERAKVLGTVAALGEFGTHVKRSADSALEEVDNRNLGFDYSLSDLREAERLLRVAKDLPTGRGAVGEGQRKAIDNAQEAVRELGFGYRRAGTTELAKALNRKRLNAGMLEADEAAASGSGFWAGVGRGLHAFEKVLFEFPVTVLQAGASRILSGLTGSTATSDAQYAAADETFRDAWRLLSNRDTGEVRNRITQATLGTASAELSEYERMYGEEGYLAAVRAEAKVLGPTITTALGMAAGDAAAASVAKLLGTAGKALGKLVTSSKVTVHGGRGGSLARLAGEGAEAAGGVPLPTPTYPWKFNKWLLQQGRRGVTTAEGDVFIASGQSAVKTAESVRHEFVHYLLTPRGPGRLTELRQGIRSWFYEKSAFARVTEEALAETYGVRSLSGAKFGLRYLRHPETGQIFGMGDVLLGGGAAAGTTAVVVMQPEGSQ